MAVGFNGNINRQKMINLMYLVFIAMMALNVSSEVLDGFDKVDHSLEATIAGTSRRNQLVLQDLASANAVNPAKAGTWYKRGVATNSAGDSLFNYIQQLKIEIARRTDGKNGNPANLKHKDDIEAPSFVMLNPVNGRGSTLRKRIEAFRSLAGKMMTDTTRLHALEQALDTRKPNGKLSWESALFEDMPTGAAITLLTKLQSDVRYAEGEVLGDLVKSVDVGDMRVNKITAQVIPQSQVVMRGDAYHAQIVLSSIDSTQSPRIYLSGKELSPSAGGLFSVNATAPGTYPIEGHVDLERKDGSIVRRNFKSEYYVTEPIASVAPTMMNVLYAGIDNPISIAVPGIASQNVTATITNGTLARKGDLWVARPGKIGVDAVVSVMAKMADGRQVNMAKTTLRVRALPDPLPYIEIKDAQGNPKRFKGGRISKAELLSARGIKAAIDDNVLDVNYSVISFSTTFHDSMGNAIPELSAGTNFSPRQIEKIRSLQRGKRFYISDVQAKGPDGITRHISPIEVIIN